MSAGEMTREDAAPDAFARLAQLEQEVAAMDSAEAVQRALAVYHDPRFRLESDQSRMSRALAAARGRP